MGCLDGVLFKFIHFNEAVYIRFNELTVYDWVCYFPVERFLCDQKRAYQEKYNPYFHLINHNIQIRYQTQTLLCIYQLL